MSKISKDTFKRLVLLYLIGKFDNGIYTNYRFQKVLYFGIKDADIHPFEFDHTRNGQYSFNARQNLNILNSIGLVDCTELIEGNEPGSKWKIKEGAGDQSQLLPEVAPSLARAIDTSVQKYGYLISTKLVELAHEDDLLNKTKLGQVLITDNLPDEIDVNLLADDCIDLELSLNPNFINSIRGLIQGIDSGEIPLKQWRTVGA